MPSIRSRLVLALLKNRHLLRGQLRRETIDNTTSIEALRERTERSATRLGKLADGIEVVEASIPGIVADWILPSGASRERAMLYFHGGGYVMGSARSHRGIVAKLVAACGIGALLFDYRLAPEHPFPAALDDALATYRWMLDDGIAPKRIVFAGDSAGGGLALATLLAARDSSLPLPAGATVLSPWTDLTLGGASYARRDPVAPDGSAQIYSAYYAAGADRRNPLISPLYGELEGLPPLLIHVGSEEAMLDDSLSFAEKARAAGVDVTLRVGEGMVHCWPALAPMFPEATAAMGEIGEWVRRRCS